MNNNYSYYPLTYPQKNIYQTEVTYPGTSIGTISATMRIIDENIDFNKLEKALNHIIEHNDSMRIRLKVINREPRQYFAEYKYEKFEVVDLRNQPIEKLYEFDEAQTRAPIDLIDNQLYQFTFLWIKDNEFAVFLKIHHLISDGWSTVRIGNYILDYYEKLQNNQEINFDRIPSYREYIMNESEYLRSDKFLIDKNFWYKKFENVNETTVIKKRKSKLISSDAKRKTFVLPDRLVNQLRNYCKETRASVFGVVLSAFAIYLNRTTSKTDITIGTLVLNRNNRRQKNTVGMFISTAPIKIDFDDSMDFKSLNKLLTVEWLGVLKHQRYPYELLLKDIREKDKEVKDLFDIVFSYQNASFTENTSSKEHTSRWHFNNLQKESLTVHIHDRDDMGQLILDYDYLTSLFYDKEIDFIHDNFIRILWHALDDASKPMSNLELIAEKEKQKLLFDFNSKAIDIKDNTTIVDLFVESAEKNADKTALIFEDQEVTYLQLDSMSNSLANEIIGKGVKSDDIVSIIIDKSIEMIVTILAVLKSGAAYLAIDSELPHDRKKYLLENSDTKILISTDEYLGDVDFNKKIISLTGYNYNARNVNCDIQIDESDLAYVMYTSGTTGNPKGVMIEHKSVVNYVYSFLDEFKYKDDVVVMQQCSYSFDTFVEEVFPTFAVGGTLVISNKSGARDIMGMVDVINANNIAVISVSPLVLNMLNKIDKMESVKLFISGGDVLRYEYYDNLIKYAQIYNTYGPTEATVCATYHKLKDDKKEHVPIGKPIANYNVYILDENLSLLPIGVAGELYISGPGLARGYLNEPELTDEVFIDNPYEPGEKMYRTRDIARWYPMGDIEYLGRIDRQVKIRGMRVELAEIENQILDNDLIKSVVVLDKNVDGIKSLCAYYEATGSIQIQDIRTHLRSRLPGYMIPSYYLEMERLPLRLSGKIDLKSLPSIDYMVLNESNIFVEPKTETEIKLVSIIQRILKKQKISMRDNFFEIGGDSLSLNTLAFEIIDQFKIEIPLENMFKADDIQAISEYIKQEEKSSPHNDADKNLVLIHKCSNTADDLFFIHDGIGGVGAYLDISEEMKEYNIWGVRATELEGIAPQNYSIKKLAKKYVNQITEKSYGPYNIAGWCIGGTVAYEVVRQLEEKELEVSLLCIIDSIPPIKWDNIQKFNEETEKDFINEHLNGLNSIDLITNDFTMEEIWDKVIDSVDNSENREIILKNLYDQIPDDIKQYVDSFDSSSTREIFSFINQIRTFHVSRALYRPKGTVKSRFIYIGARSGSVTEDSREWGKYVSGIGEFTKVKGNHLTIMQFPGSKEISDIIKEKVSSKCQSTAAIS